MTVGSTVTLLADANDFDGQVQSVRFYGNGEDLGVQVLKTIDQITVTANGQGYTAPPTVTIDPPPGGEDRGQRLVALAPPPNGPNGQPNNNAPRVLPHKSYKPW